MLVRNPFFKKINLAQEGQPTASYRGIAFKSIWFWLLTFVGLASYFYLPESIGRDMFLVASLALALICLMLTYWFPMTTPLAGSIYSLLQGYMLAMISQSYIKDYGYMIYIALGITALTFVAMLVLYSSGIIKVNQKFRATIFSAFIVAIAGPIIVKTSSIFTNFLTDIFYGNTSISIAVAVISLLLAAVNLVFEFDFTKKIVEDGASKKYEWLAAYGIFMTIIVLFVNILEIISRLTSKKESR